MTTIAQWILDTVAEYSSVEDPWVDPATVIDQAEQQTLETHSVDIAIGQCIERGDLYRYDGRLAPTDEATLTAICERERESDEPDRELVAEINELRAERRAAVADGGAVDTPEGIELTAESFTVRVSEVRSLGEYENVEPSATVEGSIGDGVALDAEGQAFLTRRLEQIQDDLRGVCKRTADARAYEGAEQ